MGARPRGQWLARLWRTLLLAHYTGNTLGSAIAAGSVACTEFQEMSQFREDLFCGLYPLFNKILKYGSFHMITNSSMR